MKEEKPKDPENYINWYAFLRDVLWFTLLLLTFFIIYSIVEELNIVVFLFFPLGGMAMLANLFFLVLFAHKIFKRLYIWYMPEQDWIKSLVLFMFVMLLFAVNGPEVPLLDYTIYIYEEVPRIFPMDLPTEHDSHSTGQAFEIDYESYKRRSESRQALGYVNKLRVEKGRRPLEWDARAYELAVARARDMVKHRYVDHITREGLCVKDLKTNYGFLPRDVLVENIGGLPHIDGKPVPGADYRDVVDDWMDSRGHRFNLLYEDHHSGAFGCFEPICVFFGIHNKIFGPGSGACMSGQESAEFWDDAPKQPGES